MNKEVERISKNYLTKPHRISVGSINEVKKNIKHEYYVVGYRQKKEALKRLLMQTLISILLFSAVQEWKLRKLLIS
jgi:superfamily II DNA/RNA helicase